MARKRKGLAHSAEEEKDGTSWVAFIKEKDKANKKMGKGNSHTKKGKTSVWCYNCGGTHFLLNCKKWQEAQKKLKNSKKE